VRPVSGRGEPGWISGAPQIQQAIWDLTTKNRGFNQNMGIKPENMGFNHI
jgi:hypothetical protein